MSDFTNTNKYKYKYNCKLAHELFKLFVTESAGPGLISITALSLK